MFYLNAGGPQQVSRPIQKPIKAAVLRSLILKDQASKTFDISSFQKWVCPLKMVVFL